MDDPAPPASPPALYLTRSGEGETPSPHLTPPTRRTHRQAAATHHGGIMTECDACALLLIISLCDLLALLLIIVLIIVTET